MEKRMENEMETRECPHQALHNCNSHFIHVFHVILHYLAPYPHKKILHIPLSGPRVTVSFSICNNGGGTLRKPLNPEP